MTWTPGQKADATKVNALLRQSYEGGAKKAIRTWITQELIASGCSLVLDFHGGGQSAEELTKAGLTVLSVDDGRQAKKLGVSVPRARRALAVAGEAGGYRTGWGKAQKYASECDGAFLDFMGQLCGEYVRTMEACRPMKSVVVTLMPERLDGMRLLPLPYWTVAYRAAVERALGMKVRHVRQYRRPGGQWVLVMVARRSYRVEACHQLAEARKRATAKVADPVVAAAYRAKKAEYMRQYRRRRYWTDPEFRARILADRASQKGRDQKNARRRALSAAAAETRPFRPCAECGVQFQFARRSEKFHSPECRLTAERRRKRDWEWRRKAAAA